MKEILLVFILMSAIYCRSQDSIIENPLPEKYRELEKFNNNIVFSFGTAKVIAICTGYISTDNKFPEPVFVWLINSPCGNYLIDAGLNPAVTDKKYFRGISKPFFERQFTFYVYKSNFLPEQLKKYGIDESNINAIVLTHAHFDHIGYLPYFRKVKVIMTEKEKGEVAASGQLAGYQKDTGKMIGFDRVEAVKIERDEMKKAADGIFLIRTDEHTKGHTMVMLELNNEKVLFTGDLNMHKMDQKSQVLIAVQKNVNLEMATLFFNHDQELKQK